MKTGKIVEEATRIAQQAFEEAEPETLSGGTLWIGEEKRIRIEGGIPEAGFESWWSGRQPFWTTTPKIPINFAESVEELAERIGAAMTLSLAARESLHVLLSETTRLRRDLAKLTEGHRKLQEQVASLLEIIEDRPIVSQTWLRDLASDTHRLKTPILVTIEQYADEVTARWPEAETFGAAPTETLALADLKNEIVDLFEDIELLKRTEPDRLGKPLQSVARVLGDTMEKLNG